MLFKTIYDVGHPDAMTAMELLLKLEYAMEIDSPWGEEIVGILKEVRPLDSNRLVELVFQIDDEYECNFYVNHSARDIALVEEGRLFNDPPCMEEC